MRRTARRQGTVGGVGEVLENVLKRVDPEQQLPAYRVWSFWDDVVGDTIARRAQPSRYRNGILFVTVGDPSWMHELQYMRAEICRRLNARLGKELITDMYLVTGHVAPAATPRASAEAEERRVEAEASGGLVVLPKVEDPGLAAAFARLVDARARRIARQRR